MLIKQWFSGRSALRPAMLLTALGLAACGDEGSKPAQRAPNDLGLEQCQLVDGTALGEPMDPIMIDGVATQACRITNGLIAAGAGAAGQGVSLKATHRYEPLVWVLDGTLTIGESRSYTSLEEFTKGGFASLDVGAAGPLRATASARIIVHRNGFFSGDVIALDASGTWGGVVVNGIGPHPQCAPDTSKEKFCNVAGEHGNYGGLSAADAQTEIVRETFLTFEQLGYGQYLGFGGSVSDAGGAASGARSLGAAIVLNAPQSEYNGRPINAFDSRGAGIEINGGYVATGLKLVTTNTQGPAVHWHDDFRGKLAGVFHHRRSDHPALLGGGGDVDLTNVTLIDPAFTAGTAISVQAGQVDLTNVLVQNFRGCLQLDAGAGATLAGVAFGCLTPTVAADDGTDYAVRATTAALLDPDSSYYEADPGLTADLRVGNSELQYVDWTGGANPGGRNVIGTIERHAGHDLRLIYPDCMGVGTLLPEDQTVTVRRTPHRICELNGMIDVSARLYNRFNEGSFAWVLNGEVSLGADFADLSEAEQLAALESPGYLFLPAGAVVFGRPGASLTVHPGVQWFVDGTADDPVEIAPLPAADAMPWGGVRINGIDRASCQAGSTAGICAYADARQLRIEYLRVLQAGANRPALQLYEVGPGAAIDHLEIADSASEGLALHGGRANLDHLLLTNNSGDQLQWEQGYRGTIQHGLLLSGAATTGQVLHGRNDGANHDASPRSRPTLANLTMIGQGAGSAILLEEGSGLLLYNSIVVDFANCLDIDDAATAALHASTPQEIAMLNVVLSCAAALADDAEDAGVDYGHVVANSSSVYQIDPQLDPNFVATNSILPTHAGLDLSLVGDAADYLDSTANGWGAVEDASDGWYLGWSGVGVLLSPECDEKGTFVDDYEYVFSRGQPLQAYPGGSGVTIEVNYKVCRLPDMVAQDLELTRYTGADAAAAASGTKVTVTENGGKYGLDGEVTWERLPAPTVWLLDGMVTVGDGARQLTDPAEAAALKASPVVLTMQPGTWVMAAGEDSGLHVTRGGRLRILGERMLWDQACSYEGFSSGTCPEFAATGPVSIFGPRADNAFGDPLPSVEDNGDGSYFGDFTPYGPLGSTYLPFWNEYATVLTRPWRGIVVDGFARNNQCPDADIAQPDGRVCNIAAELGYHGGYDDEHANVEIRNLYMAGGLLHLNSVTGSIDGLRYFSPASFSSDQIGEASIVNLEGGRINIRELVIHVGTAAGDELYFDAKPGSLISWNHGYRGSLQHIYGFSRQISNGQETLVQANGRNYFIPLVRGANGGVGHENDLPRSMPTIANVSLISSELDATTSTKTPNIDSSLFEVVRGSGLFLHHSIVGSDWNGGSTDFCIKVDASVADRIAAGEFRVDQLAATCAALTDNAGVTLDEMAGINNGYLSSPAQIFPASYDSHATERSFVDEYGPDALPIKFEHDRRYPIQNVVDDYGRVTLDLSSSTTADTEFLDVTDYLGTLNYWNKP